MQTHHKEATPVFLNTTVNKEETTFMCALKQENASIEKTCQLASPTFDSPVKRPLIDSGHAMTTPHTKRVKQERDWDPSFWENKERLLLSNKTSLQSIVSEVAHSFESVKNPSFQGMEASDFESSNLNPSGALDETIALGRKFESSPPIAAVTKEVGHENVEALAPTVDSHKENISVLSPIAADQVSQAEATKPILRALKSLESGISDGYAFDHNFFPNLSVCTRFHPQHQVRLKQNHILIPNKHVMYQGSRNLFKMKKQTILLLYKMVRMMQPVFQLETLFATAQLPKVTQFLRILTRTYHM
ncbi:hypothetical protein OS493_022902 [Desmophyllum pertusum]|uniref:Uncharacterized protein n=1 Tax=Desmophyllum pertusum TaxID=174260 RepID=A0A9X0D3E8_9CNID|nr:hypothetical protein OS493_022902 [Desmophyllum pertusum]